VSVTPSARRLTRSLRDIGYDFTTALSDIVDNSISAGAEKIDVEIVFDGTGSYVLIADDGSGMTERRLAEAMRFGTRRDYAQEDLGRYGLGLKTASISQCRRLTVVTRQAVTRRRLAVLTLDMDHVERTDRWEVTSPPIDSMCDRALEWLDARPGTVVVWEKLDRVLPVERPDGGWARRRLEQTRDRAASYLGMVFHRYLEGTLDRDRITITVNGEKVRPWNPFAPDEEHRSETGEQRFEVATVTGAGQVSFRGYVLPPRTAFSSLAEFERLSGPLKWNRQQGLYIYRNGRLIQAGGWSGIRAIDEHTKLARAALDFPAALDEVFRINVAKMRVLIPPEVRSLLERPVNELCHRADAAYRRDPDSRTRKTRVQSRDDSADRATCAEAGAALIAAALDVGASDALERIMARLTEIAPRCSSALGW
jgi:hypothetical protein